MNIEQFSVIYYILFWAIRINGCVRRGRQPLLRGPEWFFNVHVQPGFYTGAGRRILRRYLMRMFIPFAVDIPVAIAIFLSGRLLLLNVLVLGLCALIHINHLFSVDLAERQARPFAHPEAEAPVASIALSLTPRRLRDYTNRKVEWALALSSLIALAWLTRYYLASPDHHNLRLVFGVPAIYLYSPVRSPAPTLLISGALDPATPPETARQAAHDLSNSRLITVKQGTHGTGSPCLDGLVAEFVKRGSVTGLDASCADQIRLPPFLTKTANQGGK